MLELISCAGALNNPETSGAKARDFRDLFGTTEAVPSRNLLMRQLADSGFKPQIVEELF